MEQAHRHVHEHHHEHHHEHDHDHHEHHEHHHDHGPDCTCGCHDHDHEHEHEHHLEHDDPDHVCDEDCCCHHHHHHEGGEVEEYGIGTYVYFRRPALNINKFDHLLANKWPKNIIRAKGICYFDDDRDKCLLFEQAGVQKSVKDIGQWFATMPQKELDDLMARDANLRRDWDDVYGDRMIKIVFIGRDLDKKAIDALMDACLE